jgi:hypothetical protein
MILTINEVTIEVPDTLDLNNVDKEADWLYNLFVEVSKLYKSPKNMWDYCFNQLFLYSSLTEQHKYFICIGFSALITSLSLSDSLTNLIKKTLPLNLEQAARDALPTLFLNEEVPTESNSPVEASESFVIY